MFESFVARCLGGVSFFLLFSYLEHQLSLGVVAAGLLALVLWRQRCWRWFAALLFAAEVYLLHTDRKYYSFLPFLLLELVAICCNPVPDPTVIKQWRPYEKEIRQFLMANDPTVLHRVDDALDEYAHREEELYRLLLQSHATRRRNAASSSSSSSSVAAGRTTYGRDDTVRQIRLLIDQHAPGVASHVDQMLRDYSGREEELLLRLREEFDVDRAPGTGTTTVSSSAAAASSTTTAAWLGQHGSDGSNRRKWTNRDSEILENAKWEASQRIQQRINQTVANLRAPKR